MWLTNLMGCGAKIFKFIKMERILQSNKGKTRKYMLIFSRIICFCSVYMLIFDELKNFCTTTVCYEFFLEVVPITNG